MTRLRGSRFAHVGLALLVTLLTAFHLLLLGARVVDGSVLDPVVAGEWLIGLGLLLGLVRLHRSGVSLVRGRDALILWLLIFVLHAVAVAPGESGSLELRADQHLLGIIPIGAVIGVAVSLFAGLLPCLAIRSRIPPLRTALETLRETPHSSTDLLSALAPRAPPA